jgi:hyaluronate lyase
VNGSTQVPELGDAATVDARWAHLDGVAGYVFLNGNVSLQVRREARTGAWRDINTGGPTTPISRRYLTMWLDHGIDPTNASYSYLVVPGASLARTKLLARHSGLLVLRNTAQVQALLSGQFLLANFWNPDQVAGLTAHTPCSVIRRVRGREIDLAIADPTQRADTVQFHIWLPKAKVVHADDGLSVRRTHNGLDLTADTKAAAGRTLRLTIRV